MNQRGRKPAASLDAPVMNGSHRRLERRRFSIEASGKCS
jgi:hypothetical protein